MKIAADRKYDVSIHYCPGCKWLSRSTWMAQELLETFSGELRSVSLNPSEQSGIFQVYVNDKLVWDRVRDSGFPQIKELKRLVRDMIAPDRKLGHLDRS